MPESQIMPDNRDDWREVRTYVDAVNGAVADLERFWHEEAIQAPHLIRVAITRSQVEPIHPFLVGLGILSEGTGQQRWRSYAFDRYLRLVLS